MKIITQATFSDEKLNLLRKDFACLSRTNTTLSERLLKYVATGDDPTVLAELALEKDPARFLNLACIGVPLGQASLRCAFFRTLEPVGVDPYLRLAKVYESAASGTSGVFFAHPSLLASARWIEILVEEATAANRNSYPRRAQATALSCDLLEQMLAADGQDPLLLLKAMLEEGGRDFGPQPLNQLAPYLAGTADYLCRHAEHISLALASASAKSRSQTLHLLAQTKADPRPFAQTLCKLGLASAKAVREAAEPLLVAIPKEVVPLLQDKAAGGSSDERGHAARLLVKVAGHQTRAFLLARREVEKAAKVQHALDEALRHLTPAPAPPAAAPVPNAPPSAVELDGPVTPALETEFRRVFEGFNELALVLAKNPQHQFHSAAPYTPDEMDEACRQLRDPTAKLTIADCYTKWTRYHPTDHARRLQPLLTHPELKPVQLIRALVIIGYLARRHDNRRVGFMFYGQPLVNVYREAHEPKLTLLDLAESLERCGLTGDIVGHDMLEWYVPVFDWEPEAVWPYFVKRLKILESRLEPPADIYSRFNWKYGLGAVFNILGKFPQLPPSILAKLWEMAIGTNRAERERAQKAIETLPDLHERLAAALAGGSFQTRAVAAEWLGKLQDRRAIPLLDVAARKEKQDAALDEILSALEKLGEPIEPYLDRNELRTDAAKGLKKGTPPALAWFPFASLPKVHWQDSGEEVPPEVITWLIVQNYKLKSPEAGPLLRRYCALMRPAEREELGRFVLAAWLEQDLQREHTEADARVLAKQRAPQVWQQQQQVLAWYRQQGHAVPATLGVTQQQVEEAIFEELLSVRGSAVGEKGILAVAGACSTQAAVAPVQQYLKQWYGYRAAQCKALIAMLSAVESPAAVSLLLSVANRFRTKGIREEAEKYVNRLAERKGWTLDELADRTMPAAGFDDDGTLELSFGLRKFIARVNANLEAVLYDDAGKALKTLPAPRQDDDAEAAAAGKKAFSGAKTELKNFVAMQTTRLYEAMCTRRSWSISDWQEYLLGHPLARFLCQRLVWGVVEGDEMKQTLRPLDDGTLTDCEDNPVTLPDNATLRLAHGCHVSSEAAAAWTKHLADYDVTPLFTQFGRAAFELTDEQRSSTQLGDYEGYMVEAFKLRGLATKFGYTRGQAQDGGWFHEYVKVFPGLGLAAQIHFSGNSLPEENRTVALSHLSFQRTAPQGPASMFSPGLRLRDVPGVLLAECAADLAAIAAAGSGFDPEWESKVR